MALIIRDKARGMGFFMKSALNKLYPGLFIADIYYSKNFHSDRTG